MKNLLLEGFELFPREVVFVKSRWLIRLVTEPYSWCETKALVFVVICVLKVFSCNIVIAIAKAIYATMFSTKRISILLML